jgi:plastocyanin
LKYFKIIIIITNRGFIWASEASTVKNNFQKWRQNPMKILNCRQSIFLILILFISMTPLLSITGCDDDEDNGATINVSMTDQDKFDPESIQVEPGDTVKWTNNDTDAHAPIVDPGNEQAGGPNSDADYPDGVPAGGTYSWKVPEGVSVGAKWYYHCRFHGEPGDGHSLGTGMVGVITVK